MPLMRKGETHHSAEERAGDRALDLPMDVIRRDVNAMIWSMRLHGIRRYYRQRFWRDETVASDFSMKLESFPRLESVAEHSWHVADIILLLAGHFRNLKSARALELAILHDKLEIVTGDQSPLGRDGTGLNAHVFNSQRRRLKDLAERDALNVYIAQLRPRLRDHQRAAFEELLEGTSLEARFVKAADKLQSFIYVLLKKRGEFKNRHLGFTLRYSAKAIDYFPALAQHYAELRQRFLVQVARRRQITVRQLEELFSDAQLQLEFWQ